MTAATIAQLFITFGPGAIELIGKLLELWDRPTLTPEQVKEICGIAKKTYDEYLKQV